MKTRYCNYMEQIKLSDEGKERLIRSVEARASARNRGERAAKVGFRRAASAGENASRRRWIPVAASVLAGVCLIISLAVLFNDRYERLPPVEKPAEGFRSYRFGMSITDINGNVLCLDRATIGESVSIGDTRYVCEAGCFLLISGTMDFTKMVIGNVTYEFDTDGISLSYVYSDRSGGTLAFREDLFACYIQEDGSVQGEVTFVFEMDFESAERFKREIAAPQADSVGELALLLENFKVFGTTVAYVSTAYGFSFAEIAVE